jgi:fructokinase
MLGHSGSLEKIGSIPVTPVDTTGAGDAFVGAVLYQLSQYSDTERRQLSLDQWKAIIANGNKAGARTCEYMGAMEAFKHLNNAIFR